MNKSGRKAENMEKASRAFYLICVFSINIDVKNICKMVDLNIKILYFNLLV